MQFTTPVPVQKANRQIDYDSAIFSVGSCFAINISEKFAHYQFKSDVNPFGILFHPVAIAQHFDRAVLEIAFYEDDIFYHQERWHAYDAHSDLSNSDKDALISELNSAAKNTRLKLQSASHVIVTLGTSWVYRHRAENKFVANCHKLPQADFNKELLSVEVVAESVLNTIQSVHSVNPDAQIIFTISPVRHLRDGFVENQMSKANLISGLHQAMKGVSNVSYFPSYEIMMDELRDYRFYASDMIHPNQLAIDYIWEKFADSFFSAETRETAARVGDIRKAQNHRPFNAESSAHQQFLSDLRNKIDALQSKHPHFEF